MRVSAIQSNYYSNQKVNLRKQTNVVKNQIDSRNTAQMAFKSEKGAAIGAIVGALAGVGITLATGGLGAGLGAGVWALLAGSYGLAGGVLGDKVTSDN